MTHKNHQLKKKILILIYQDVKPDPGDPGSVPGPAGGFFLAF